MKRARRALLTLTTVLLIAGLSPGQAQSQTVIQSFVPTAEMLAGARYRSFNNTGGSEIFLGVPDLGVGGNRNETNATWVSGLNTITWTLDRGTDSMTATLSNSAGNWNLTYPNLSTQIAVLGKTFTLDDLDIMQIDVANRDSGTTVNLLDITLDAVPLVPDDIITANPSFTTWMVFDYDFSVGFTITATIELGGSFSNSQELSRVELKVGRSDFCGNSIIDPPDEECDPPDGVTCDFDCKNIVCGNGVVQPSEECDDGNTEAGDGCGADCQFEEKFCFTAKDPAPARRAKRVAFASDLDYTGTGSNADGNTEIFLFEKKKFDKAVKKRVKKGEDKEAVQLDELTTNAALHFTQVSDTAGCHNETPTPNGSGRFISWVSTCDIPETPVDDPMTDNADGNKEIFHRDIKKNILTQITDSVGHDNLNPNLRASRGKLLLFDSTADLVPDQCVGGDNDLEPCSTGCVGGACGNPELNREVFEWVRLAAKQGNQGLRQLTAATSGSSTIGTSVNFNTRATAFASTADLLGANPEGNSEIYRIQRGAESLVQLTDVSDPTRDSTSPSQAKKKFVALASTADLDPSGNNVDGNTEIFHWAEKEAEPFSQITDTSSCANGSPSSDNFGRFLAFESTCDLLPAKGNPDQSIFVFDTKVDKATGLPKGFLQLVIRGPMSSSSSNPQATKKVRTVTFSTDEDTVNEGVCFFDTKDELLELTGGGLP